MIKIIQCVSLKNEINGGKQKETPKSALLVFRFYFHNALSQFQRNAFYNTFFEQIKTAEQALMIRR